jgi:hypothetical protein
VHTIIVQPVKQDISPLDRRWRIKGEGLSVELCKQVVWLSGRLPFEQARQALSKLSGIELATTTLWEQTRKIGARWYEQTQWQEQHVGIERTQWQHQSYDPHAYRSISMDGGMVNLRGEGYKEMKVGMVSDIQHCWQDDQHPIRLVDMDYTAVLGDVEQFRQSLWALAVKHDVPYAGHTAVTADGAAWIWKLSDDLFPTSLQIVDWYHARQHLADLSAERHPDDPLAAHRWFQHQSTPLYQGEVWRFLDDIQLHCPDVSPTYFINHQRRMHYADFRAAGYPIGSGAVESGIKQFKQRLTGPGMRWSRAGAQQMILIRSALMTNSLDALWPHPI